MNDFKKIVERYKVVSFFGHIAKLMEGSHSEVLNRELLLL
jgi:hypothetical protein